MQNLHLEGAYLELRNIDGGAGGRATIGIHYAAEKSGKLRLIVNGADYSFVNTSATGGWSNFTGYSGLTVPLGPGKTNVVRLLGGHGSVNVDCLKVTPFDTTEKQPAPMP
ncbi:MAG: hypothetical protein HOP33_01480 [Verrucomicrobia bacterium]|nr:hypothetical protein [Verrucomicrobiota bacterium]